MRAYVPKACQHFIFTCQRAKDIPFFKLAYQRAKSMPTFYFYVPTCQHVKHEPVFKLACQRAKSTPTFYFYVPTCQRRATFHIGMPTCQKACQFFKYFSKEKMFQVWLTFASFKNTCAILENLSREAKNLKQNILTVE